VAAFQVFYRGRIWAFANILAKNFDTSKRVILKGQVDVTLVPPGDVPVILMLTVREAGNKTTRWVIAGDKMSVLVKAGWRFGPSGLIKPGDVVTISGYVVRSESHVTEELEE
jgi:hypothetical protein